LEFLSLRRRGGEKQGELRKFVVGRKGKFNVIITRENNVIPRGKSPA